jgi:hypothetical protein
MSNLSMLFTEPYEKLLVSFPERALVYENVSFSFYGIPERIRTVEFTSLSGIHNSFTSSSPIFELRGLRMVNCPECGKPLKRDTCKAKYFCENDACSVIFVCHPDKQSIIKIAYKAKARSFESEQIAAK